jgi:hypothetical protein
MTTPLDLLNAEPVWSWGVHPESKFNRQVLNYLRSVAQLRRAPRKSDPSTEAKQANSFMVDLRCQKRANTLPISRCQHLENLPFWTWEPRTEIWESRIHRVRDFVLRHGRLPPSTCASRDTTRILEAYRKGTLAQRYIEACNDIPYWVWPPLRSSIFSSRIYKIRHFVSTKGYEPAVLRSDPEEAVLGRTLSKARYLYRMDKLPADRVLLCETIPGFTWDPDPIQSRSKRQRALNQRKTKHEKKRLPSPNQSPKGRR